MQIYLDEAHRDRRSTMQVKGYLYWVKGDKLRYKVHNQHDRDCMLNIDYSRGPEELLGNYTMTYDVRIKLER